MKTRLQRLVFAIAAVIGLGVPAAFAEDAQPIEGYFRVQSVLGAANGSGYVEVRGPFTTAPDVTLDQARVSAGTVMRLRAFPEMHDGKLRYKVGNLRSQGIEVFGVPIVPSDNDYSAALLNIVNGISTSNFEAAAYGLQRAAAQNGYIATSRLLIQAVFQVVAGRLDSEIANLSPEVKEQLGITADQETLEDFAKRFDSEVAAKLDLHAYLEPVADGQYRLYFHWLDCTTVSQFYLANEQNKKSFEIGFACMRQYLQGKDGIGATGERIGDAEAALWKSWGYDIDVKYHDLYTLGENGEENYYAMTYEKIFADHEVLYNWLKMYIERFLDPEKAPNASILGINFKDFATEMQRHAIMQGFLKYIPSIQEGQKLYLSNGRFSDGVNEYSTVGTVSDNSNHFGLLAEQQADAAGNAAIWNVIPVDETTDNYFAIDPVGHRINKPGESDAQFMSIFVDFPFTKAEGCENLKFYTVPAVHTLQTATLDNLGEITYVDVPTEEVTTVERATAVLVESTSADPVYNKVRLVYKADPGDYNPEINNDTQTSFPVTDEEVDVQHAPARTLASNQAKTFGVLLSTPATETALKHQAGIEDDLTGLAAYVLGSRADKIAAETQEGMTTPWFGNGTGNIPANHAFLIAPQGLTQNAISLGVPADEEDPITGIENVTVGNDTPADNVIYDLNGRRVANVRPGAIYILNGKKILVR